MDEKSLNRRVAGAQARIAGAVFLLILAIAGWIGNIFTVIFTLVAEPGAWPLWLSVPFLIASLIGPLLARWLWSGAVKTLTEVQRQRTLTGLGSVTGPLPQYDAPAPVGDVVAHLESLDEKELPYTVSVEPDGRGAKVTVQWRVEDLKWRTFMQRGKLVFRWRMIVTLDADKGTYKFAEYHSSSTIVGDVAKGTLSGAKSWNRSKSMGAGKVSHVWAVGEVTSPDGRGTHGKAALRPSDAKIPVFTVLRAYGWRPKRDSTLARAWEY
ncbi:hypothetical protein [Demequina sediminicola]|uniref:hypothetical protein n=1 Tax=Demequina sediminicola TaxID=1095026 RepID=UPI000782723E|nr:hypothetical protein [Demequina sediminicola]